MELHFANTALQLEQPQGTCRSQLSVAGDVTLPGSLREATRVLHADAYAVLESCEALQDRISASGRVVFRVLYAQGDPEHVDSIEASADFTHLCEMQGVTPRSEICAQVQVEHVDASVSGGRMSMRAVLRLDAYAMSSAPVEVLTAAEGDTALQRTEPVKLRRTVAKGASDVLLREEFALPSDLAIRQTLFARAWPVLRDTTGGLGSVGLSGEVMLEAVHASDLPGKPIVVTRHALPFQQSVETAGDAGEMLDGRVAVKDVAVASQEAGEGEYTLRAEILLGMQAWADREETVSILEDAYTTSGDALRLNRTALRVRTGDSRMHAAESGKTALLLPETAKPVRTVLASFVTPVLTAFDQQGTRLQTEGVLEATVVYLSDDASAIQSARMEAPFRMTFAASAGREDLVTLSATDVEAVPVTADRIEMRYVLHLQTEGASAQIVSAVTDASTVPADAPTRDIVLYYVQPGDSLWDVAKRYRVSEDSLRVLNPDLSGEPKTGQGIVVWRRSAGE